jgi:hypothetical protein
MCGATSTGSVIRYFVELAVVADATVVRLLLVATEAIVVSAAHGVKDSIGPGVAATVPTRRTAPVIDASN